MQVLKKKTNPWTLTERQIIAAIVNEALSIQLEAVNIVGAVTSGDKCEVVWRVNGERNSFWFDLGWFRVRVQFKKAEQALVNELKTRNFTILPTVDLQEGWDIVKPIGNRYVGQIAWVDGVWMIRASYGEWINAGANVHDAVFSMWMREVAVVA